MAIQPVPPSAGRPKGKILFPNAVQSLQKILIENLKTNPPDGTQVSVSVGCAGKGYELYVTAFKEGKSMLSDGPKLDTLLPKGSEYFKDWNIEIDKTQSNDQRAVITMTPNK